MMRSEAVVMVVDDDFDVCEVYAGALMEAGYDVEIAHNGRDALDFLEAVAARPALILVDLMMPVMDGRELIAALRDHAAFAAIPVVVMTANRGEPAVDGVPLLHKPFSITTLHETVRRHLGGRRAS